MRWVRTLQTIDVHCAGEIGRVIVGGVLDIPGFSMAEKLRYINEVDDSIRRLLCSEPRSGPAGSVVLLTPPTISSADIGFIVLQPDKAHAMSGSNAMCAVTALLETGMKPMTEGETQIVLDTAAGPVIAVAQCRGGKVISVTLDMPPAFLLRKAQRTVTPAWGDLTFDICFGGVFFGLVHIDQVGLKIVPKNARALADAGVELHDLISKEAPVIHPETPPLNGLAYVMFYDDEPDGGLRTCAVLKPGRVDRSPCGTGTNAAIALRWSTGFAKPGDNIVSRSIIGSEFTVEFRGTDASGKLPAVRNRISGRCWVYGLSQIGLDPDDPFPTGFHLSDTWGTAELS